MNMRSIVVALVCAVCLSAAWVIAQESLPGPQGGGGDALREAPPTDAKHYSYAIGLDIVTSFRTDKLELDAESLLAGLKDGVAGAEPKFSKELCAVALQRMSAERAASVQKRDRDFLAANAKVEGVQTLPSGLQIKVLKQGAGATPTLEDTVQAHYTGKLVDGSVFDSSAGGDPATFPVGRVIPGWTEALQKMKVGDKWELVIPSELGYGESGDPSGTIPPNATLIFEVELMGIEGK